MPRAAPEETVLGVAPYFTSAGIDPKLASTRHLVYCDDLNKRSLRVALPILLYAQGPAPNRHKPAVDDMAWGLGSKATVFSSKRLTLRLRLMSFLRVFPEKEPSRLRKSPQAHSFL